MSASAAFSSTGKSAGRRIEHYGIIVSTVRKMVALICSKPPHKKLCKIIVGIYCPAIVFSFLPLDRTQFIEFVKKAEPIDL